MRWGRREVQAGRVIRLVAAVSVGITRFPVLLAAKQGEVPTDQTATAAGAAVTALRAEVPTGRTADWHMALRLSFPCAAGAVEQPEIRRHSFWAPAVAVMEEVVAVHYSSMLVTKLL